MLNDLLHFTSRHVSRLISVESLENLFVDLGLLRGDGPILAAHDLLLHHLLFLHLLSLKLLLLHHHSLLLGLHLLDFLLLGLLVDRWDERVDPVELVDI